LSLGEWGMEMGNGNWGMEIGGEIMK